LDDKPINCNARPDNPAPQKPLSKPARRACSSAPEY
jgi:hypothetical protein